MSKLAALFLCIFLAPAAASAPAPQMNGLSLRTFGDFTKRWKLVTVRFRLDTREMRFVYANEAAWETLAGGKYPFKEGSAFAKVAFRTSPDPSFGSSLAPFGTRRFQLMLKDSKKNPDTNGWAYGLFKADGTVFEGDVRQMTTACHACHRAVPERDYVFAEAAALSPFTPIASMPSSAYEKKFEFEDFESQKLPQVFRAELGSIPKIRSLKGPVRDHVFGGTMDEVTALLIGETMRAGIPAALVSTDQAHVKVVLESKKQDCPTAGEKRFDVLEIRPKKTLERYSVCFPSGPADDHPIS